MTDIIKERKSANDHLTHTNPNTGLEYLRSRYYNASKGRFFQEDTYLGSVMNPLTLNRYAYVKNSPLNYVDPTGHFWEEIGEYASDAYDKTVTSLLNSYHKLIYDYLKDDSILISSLLKLSINLAIDKSELDDCELWETSVLIGDLLLGFLKERGDLSAKALNRILGGLVNPYFSSKLIHLIESMNEEAEEEFAYNYLNPEAFYLGKYLSDLLLESDIEMVESIPQYLIDQVKSVGNALGNSDNYGGFNWLLGAGNYMDSLNPGLAPEYVNPGGSGAALEAILNSDMSVPIVITLGGVTIILIGSESAYAGGDLADRFVDNNKKKNEEKYEQAKGSSNSEEYYKKGLKEIPDDWIEVEAAESLLVKSDSFKDFLRDQGYNPKKWRKVVEKWASPDGTIYQRNYWTDGTNYYYHGDGIEEFFPH